MASLSLHTSWGRVVLAFLLFIGIAVLAPLALFLFTPLPFDTPWLFPSSSVIGVTLAFLALLLPARRKPAASIPPPGEGARP